MREGTGRDDQVRGRGTPPLGTTWHQDYEAGKKLAAAVHVWCNVLQNRIDLVKADLLLCDKWAFWVADAVTWLTLVDHDMKTLDREYESLLRQSPTKIAEQGEEPEGGSDPDVDALTKDLKLSTHAQPLDGGQRTFRKEDFRTTGGSRPVDTDPGDPFK